MKLLNNDLFTIALPPIVLLVLHVLITEVGLYERFWWFDIPMHFLGGILVALAVLGVLNHFVQEKMLMINSLALKILIVVSVTALFAVSWETMEFLSDIYFNTGLQASLSDTMKDMSMGIIGASVVSLVLYLKSLSKK
ncbi:MAG TPA: hypothetical protein VHQ20_00530 [Patescibacteria group bacterium]|nr:hypothetical protein [Patescibacteria group bacterium]